MSDSDRQGTRERILDAAGKVFAERGFRAATVRQISRLAEANVALLHYYFKDKAGLYQAVLEDLFELGFREFPADTAAGGSAQQRLEAFIHGFLFRLLSPRGWGGYEGKARLLTKEMADPSPLMDRMIERYLKPYKDLLAAVVAELLGPDAGPDLVRRCVVGVVGQCLHYAYAKPVMDRLEVSVESRDEDIAKLAEHVSQFSLGGIARIREWAASRAAGGAR